MVIYDLLTGMIVKELAGHQGVVRYSPVSWLLIENLLVSLFSIAPQLNRYIPVIVVSWRLSFPIHEPLDQGYVVAPVVIVSYLLCLD